ncbi:uncharacterized protein LOC127652205 isoform X2 [Xyrauchen texanus]|uniref:uncharacterized protein LOC127652205 isoform X2 n=1 Tax=Xyrauchen texanus TaxID=154827 RepID=UPI00224251B4|nr:uncharacterized protein LOC127652205 isoform X2 [Xyrauchen texanus]
MVRNYKRKTNRASTAPDTMLKAVRQVLVFKKNIRAAAEEFGINYRTLARYCTKIPREEVEGNADYPSCTVGFTGARQVFNPEHETELVSYISRAADIYYALPPEVIRKFTYQLAKHRQLQIPSSWRKNKQASADWFAAFLKRHPTLSVRKPEPPTLLRASNFKRSNIEMFFSKLKEVMEHYSFKPEDIWTMDETGVTTAQRPDRVVSRKALAQASADKGPLVTVSFTISASGNMIPPYFVFPRMQFRQHFLTGAPSESAGGANLNGWMSKELFVDFLEHFIQQTKCYLERPCLLLLDSHVSSHWSIEGLSLAKANGIVALSFPPHCSLLQPLERSVFGPFKKCINAAIDSWMLGGPGRSVTIHHIPGIVATALPLAATPTNITEGFKACGIIPLNPNIIEESDFALSFLMDSLSSASSGPADTHFKDEYTHDTPDHSLCTSLEPSTSHCDPEPTANDLQSCQRQTTPEKDDCHLDWLPCD